jgi:hypothetical protein
MIVGAHCRDILRGASGPDSGLRTTEDVDFGLTLADWAAFDELTKELEPAGNTGIRYQVADVPTDLIPFGDLEDPSGTVRPARREPINVWGFSEVFQTSRPLPLPDAGTIRIPTIAGYAALKLVAWLDRSAWGAYKDASDIATVLHWYFGITRGRRACLGFGPRCRHPGRGRIGLSACCRPSSRAGHRRRHRECPPGRACRAPARPTSRFCVRRNERDEYIPVASGRRGPKETCAGDGTRPGHHLSRLTDRRSVRLNTLCRKRIASRASRRVLSGRGAGPVRRAHR